MLVAFSLAYLAAFALYQGHRDRCVLSTLPSAAIPILRLTGYGLLLSLLAASMLAWGGPRGVPLALAALSLAAPLSLLLASRWPHAHILSAPLAAALLLGGILS